MEKITTDTIENDKSLNHHEAYAHFLNIENVVLDNLNKLPRLPNQSETTDELEMLSRWLFEEYYSCSIDGPKDSSRADDVLRIGTKLLEYGLSLDATELDRLSAIRDCGSMSSFLSMKESYLRLVYRRGDERADEPNTLFEQFQDIQEQKNIVAQRLRKV